MPRAVSSQVSPFASTRPCSGRSSPAATRRRLVLPAPEGPASARHSPCSTVSSTSSRSAPSVVPLDAQQAVTPLPAAERLAAPDQLDRQQDGCGHRHEHRGQREGGVEVGREAVVDGERNGLGDALERAGEHQRRAELSERTAEGQSRSRGKPRQGDRDHHSQEAARLGGAERARCVEQRRSTAANAAIAWRT